MWCFFTHQHVVPVVRLTNTDRTARQTQLKLFNTLTQSHRKYDIILYIMCTVSVSRRKVCKLHSEWETVPNDEANRVKQTSHLLCLLWASDRMYWGRWSTVDCKGNKHLDVRSSHSDQFIPNMVCAAHGLPVRCSVLMTESQVFVIMFEVLLLDATTPINTQKHQWPRSAWPHYSGQLFSCICVDGSLGWTLMFTPTHQCPSKSLKSTNAKILFMPKEE